MKNKKKNKEAEEQQQDKNNTTVKRRPAGQNGRGVRQLSGTRGTREVAEATRQGSIGRRAKLCKKSKYLGAGGIAKQIVDWVLQQT